MADVGRPRPRPTAPPVEPEADNGPASSSSSRSSVDETRWTFANAGAERQTSGRTPAPTPKPKASPSPGVTTSAVPPYPWGPIPPGEAQRMANQQQQQQQSASAGVTGGAANGATSEDPDMRRFFKPQQNRARQINWLPPTPSQAAINQFGTTTLDFGIWKDATYAYVWENDWNYCVWVVEESRRSARSSTNFRCFADWIK